MFQKPSLIHTVNTMAREAIDALDALPADALRGAERDRDYCERLVIKGDVFGEDFREVGAEILRHLARIEPEERFARELDSAMRRLRDAINGSHRTVVDLDPQRETNSCLEKFCARILEPHEKLPDALQRDLTLRISMKPRLETPTALQSIWLVTGEELAEAMRFDGVKGAFRKWCKDIGIEPVPGRRNLYDPKLVRARLDAVQGMQAPPANVEAAPTLSLVEQRRMRRDNLSA